MTERDTENVSSDPQTEGLLIEHFQPKPQKDAFLLMQRQSDRLSSADLPENLTQQKNLLSSCRELLRLSAHKGDTIHQQRLSVYQVPVVFVDIVHKRHISQAIIYKRSCRMSVTGLPRRKAGVGVRFSSNVSILTICYQASCITKFFLFKANA